MRPPTAVLRIPTGCWALQRSSAGCLLVRRCRKRNPRPSDWDLTGCETEFRRALELDPNYTAAHHLYSHCLLVLGRTEESLAESKRALELEPLQLVIGIHLGWHYLYAPQYDTALEHFCKTLELGR